MKIIIGLLHLDTLSAVPKGVSWQEFSRLEGLDGGRRDNDVEVVAHARDLIPGTPLLEVIIDLGIDGQGTIRVDGVWSIHVVSEVHVVVRSLGVTAGQSRRVLLWRLRFILSTFCWHWYPHLRSGM